MTLDHIKSEGLTLPPTARRELAYFLLESLDETEMLHPAWEAELDRRWQAVQDGAPLLSAESVERELALKHGISL